MRLAFLALLVIGAACSPAIDPDTANITGHVAMVDAATSKIGVSTNRIACITAPCYDYTVRVTGKVFLREGGGYREIAISQIPAAATAWVWIEGPVLESLPAQVDGRQVVVTPD